MSVSYLSSLAKTNSTRTRNIMLASHLQDLSKYQLPIEHLTFVLSNSTHQNLSAEPLQLDFKSWIILLVSLKSYRLEAV